MPVIVIEKVDKMSKEGTDSVIVIEEVDKMTKEGIEPMIA